MFNENTPEQGRLLLSEPFILDPTFERSVVMLCEHTTAGSLGLILNHKSQLLLSDIIADLSGIDLPVYLGGPVENHALFFLHRAYDKLKSGTLIHNDIYWGGDFDLLKILLQEGLIGAQEIKFFIGYSGWDPHQLHQEIEQNSWAVHQKYDSDLIFLLDGEDLWKQALISLGPKYAHVANFPKSPFLN
ncbi:YqgE/AlgH family protein [Sphingobacterium sp. Mn56C]|uniref:YqgE/AlgH family protein n=1 Tax=Sphingobacterium sp. Mn56C TaxID=3395261 RepID=UPI003BE2E718